MMDEFARCYEKRTSQIFDLKKHHIRYVSAFSLHNIYNKYILICLAHIINLTTQVLISMQSKSKYYDPSQDEHPTDIDIIINHNKVGLVRAICVNVQYFA